MEMCIRDSLLIVFSMVVPFQMVMFTLSKTADRLNLNNPWNICIIYLGFGAGLAVFMFTGFMKSVPMEIEEAAMIDGCNPIQIFFKVVFPILKPTMISTAILETMWVWNDYLPVSYTHLSCKPSCGRDAWGVRGESLRFFQKPLLITSYWIFNGWTVSCQNGRSSLSSMTAKSSALPAE